MQGWIPGRPRSKGNSKTVIRMGKRLVPMAPKAERLAEKEQTALAKVGAPKEPLAGPLILDVVFVMPIAKSWPRKKREAAANGTWVPSHKPDRGNLLKMLEDVLEAAGYYLNDSQIVGGEVVKICGPETGTWFNLRQWEYADVTKWMAAASRSPAPL